MNDQNFAGAPLSSDEAEKKKKRAALKSKIIGGIVVAIALFALFGEQIVEPFTLPREYKKKMVACLEITKQTAEVKPETDEEKICSCATDPANGPLGLANERELAAWAEAKRFFFKEAKAKYQLPATALTCEVYDALKNSVRNR